MAIPIVPINEAADVWSQRATGAAARYNTRAAAAGPTWESTALGAQGNFQAAVTAANIGAKYAGGVRKAGAASYTQGVTQKGQQRYPSGVQVSRDKYVSGAQPYFDTIAGLNIQVRRPRGDATNIQRVAQVAAALTARRLALQGAGTR